MKFSWLIYIFFCLPIYAQKIESKSYNDSIYAANLLSEARKNKTRNIDSVYADVWKALKIAEINKFDYLAGKCNSTLASILINKGGEDNLKQSILHFDKALALLSKYKDSSIQSLKHSNNLSIVYRELQDFPEALKFALNAVKLSNKIKDDKHKAHDYKSAAHLTLGSIYDALNLSDSALYNYKQAHFHYKEINHPRKHHASHNIGLTLMKLKKYEESQKYLQNALAGYREQKSLFSEANTLNNLGILFTEIEKYSEAKKQYRHALEITIKKKFLRKQYFSLYGLSEVFYKEKNYDSLNYFLSKAMIISDSLKNLELKAQTLLLKSKQLEAVGNYKESLAMYELSEQLTDSVNKKQNSPETTMVLVNHQNQINEATKKGFKSILTKKNVLIISISITMLILIVIGYFVKKRDRLKLKISDEQRKQLQVSLHNEHNSKQYINRKLVVASANLALKTELLSQINVLLNQIKTKKPQQNLHKEINETQNQIKIQKSMDNMWQEFFTHFEEVHPEFLTNLQTKYGVNQHDLKICAFLKMNLSNKEICHLLNIHPTTVRVNIHRIKKKLEIPKEVALSEFLSVN